MEFGKDMFLFTCVCFVVISVNRASDPQPFVRSLKSEYLCKEADGNCVHITATSPNDTLHYFISSIGTPSLVVVQTTNDAKLTFNKEVCTNQTSLKKGDIHFDKQPLYSYAIVFPIVYQYNDSNDYADMELIPNERSYWKLHELDNMDWLPMEDISNVNGSHVFYLNVTSNATSVNKSDSDPFTFEKGGYFSLKFEFETSNMRSELSPHLEYNGNNTQISMTVNHAVPAFENSRFGLQLVVLSDKDNATKMDLVSTDSIDDEHTPGVFRMIDWTTQGEKQTSGGYVQWKPVCYKQESREFTSQTKAFYYTIEALNDSSVMLDKVANSLATAYFGRDEILHHVYSMGTANISFGITKDKFYADTSYTSWTFSTGVGSPPSDTVSLMIKLVISVGLGLPVVLILFGGIFVCVRNKKKSSEILTSSYTEIQ